MFALVVFVLVFQY